MKALFSYSTAYVAVLACSISFTKAQEVALTQVWQSDTTIRTPESVLFEPKENVLYISCINGGPSAENKNSYIAKVSPEGKVLNAKFTEGLNSTKGLGLLNNKLYVTEMTAVAEIDLKSGKILNRYPVEGAVFLNDIAVDNKNATVYISDSRTNKIHALTNGKIRLILEGSPLKNNNGLLVEDGQLLIGNGDGSLLSMNIATGKISTIAQGMGGIDGIVALGGKKYIVSEWPGKVWYINSGSNKLLLDSTKEKINTADIEFNPKTKTLYVPNFYQNTVTAYSIGK